MENRLWGGKGRSREHSEEANAVTEPETVVTWTNMGVIETKKKRRAKKFADEL